MLILHIPSWFPTPDKPLDGNFILKHIATTTPFAKSIVLHHVDESLRNQQIISDESIVFYPIYVRKNMSKRQLFGAYICAYKEIESQYGKPDVIHAHVALPLGVVAARLSRKYHIPLVLSEHWSIYRESCRNNLSLIQRCQMRYVYAHVSHLTTVTEHLHQMIVQTMPTARAIPSTVISNVVNTEVFDNKANGGHETKRILHVSTLDPIKNILGILRAVEQLAQHRQDFHLDIINEIENPEVQKFIADHGLSEFVSILGKKSETEVAETMQQSDFMVMFSNYETQSCVLLETFCCGRPAIATAVGGIPEFANEANAVFVEPKNESQLVEKLNYMLDHYTDYNGQTIRDNIISICSKSVVCDKFENIYKSIINH